MRDPGLVAPSAEFLATARLKAAEARALFDAAARDPAAFWAAQARARLQWMTPFTEVMDVSFHKPVRIRWFADGVLNVSANCLDRHLPALGAQTAILWQGDDPQHVRRLTYRELYEGTCRMANVLKQCGVQKGDRVTMYLPMIPEAAMAMLACARIGAVHSVVFAGFSAESLRGRIEDCGSRLVITADEGVRGGKTIPLKANVDAALAGGSPVENVLVVRRTGAAVPMQAGRDEYYEALAEKAAAECPPEPMGAEDPLFILYTSGSTGKPKGVLHTSAGYLLFAAATHEWVFDVKPAGSGDIYWCTADVGWVTGHSYIVYGPLANGVTTLMFEGVPTWPDAARFWQVVDQHRVTHFYTAPTAIRALMREGDGPVLKTSRASLRLLGSVGEPINPEAWRWYWRVVGGQRCPVVDTWWQTETGGILISALPGVTALKPGAAQTPLPGIQPALVTSEGARVEGAGEGHLVLSQSWPGQMRTVYGDHARFEETYFSTYPGCYFTGDGARRDADGDYTLLGRVDDVINVSGHRLGTAEVESALVAHPQVAEAAVIGVPHEIKGQGIYAFVTLMADAAESEALRAELTHWVRQKIGPIAAPDAMQFAPALPKTRSGKIMRRILRKIVEGDTQNLGDTSTLADPSVVAQLVKGAAS